MTKFTKGPPINERIAAAKVQLIDEKGNNVGLIETFKALNIARVKGLDLMQVSDREVPVCRILDYAKYRYTKAKKKQRLETCFHAQGNPFPSAH